MVPDWKRATSVRVFLCVDSRRQQTSVLHREWEHMLLMLRIEATIHVVVWDTDTSAVQTTDDVDVHFAATLPETIPSHNETSDKSIPNSSAKRHQPFDAGDEDFLSNVNTMIQDHSRSTSVVFLYLPVPPPDRQHRKGYLNRLDTLTAGLPPTLLVHGISPVTSVTL